VVDPPRVCEVGGLAVSPDFRMSPIHGRSRMPLVVQAAIKAWTEHIRDAEGERAPAVIFVGLHHPILVDALVVRPDDDLTPILIGRDRIVVGVDDPLGKVQPHLGRAYRDDLEDAAHDGHVVLEIYLLDVDGHVVIGGITAELDVVWVFICRNSVHPDIPDIHASLNSLIMGFRLATNEGIAPGPLIEPVGEPTGAPAAIDQVSLKRSDRIVVEEYVTSVVIAIRGTKPEVIAIRAKRGAVIERSKHDMVIELVRPVTLHHTCELCN